MREKLQHSALRQALIDARQRAKLTQTALAESLHRPQSFVSKYESGERRVEVIEFLEICHALNVSPHQILDEITENHGQ